MKKEFAFQSEVWLYSGPAAWHFITVPTEVSDKIDFYFGHLKKGWGSLPVQVTIKHAHWKTSIFPDKKTKSYLLPFKAAVRQELAVKAGDSVSVTLTLEG